ncbi:MAG: hypothetical protein U1A62_18050, partial [Pseudomonas sp.]|nr:hypothetical protein [Pseudomonas sp.]
PLGWIVVQVLQNHAHGTFTDFRGVGRGLFHSLIFSRVEASTKPGAIQHQVVQGLFEGGGCGAVTIKRQFGYVKVRLRGLAKNTAQLVTLFALSNLWMARRHVLATAGEVRL